MGAFEAAAVLVTIAALFSYANHRFLKLPTTVGLMAMALAGSLLLLLASRLVPAIDDSALALLGSIDFTEALLHGMLGFLLFAGALHVDLGDLTKQKWVIALLATVGVTLSTGVVGALSWLVLNRLLGFQVEFIHCLLFGALISPTDPIAVLSILKTLGTPRSLGTKIAGESLFNDGVGVVLFLTLLGVAGLGDGHGEPGFGEAARIFLQEAVGGAIFGLLIGYACYRLLATVDDYQVEILLSLALVAGGYAAATALHLSGPIAMVVAGLLIGNHGRTLAMSEKTRVHLDTFWELVDEILNAVLFVLIGLEVLILPFEGRYLLAGALLIPITLLARWLAVGVPVGLLGTRRRFTAHAIKVLTWGGLRGGISVALALWMGRLLGAEHATTRDLVLVMTYAVVAFSILVQGLTIGPLVGRLGLRGEPVAAADGE